MALGKARLIGSLAIMAIAFFVFDRGAGGVGGGELLAAERLQASSPSLSAKRPGGAAVEGFRSARFGMDEAEVVRAIKKDFAIRDEKLINKTVNDTEKTTSFVVTVDDILPNSGSALVAHVFGYSSKKLMQVNIQVGDPVGKLDGASLVGIANNFRNYFSEQGFDPAKVVVNTKVPSGSVIVFRGVDESGRMILVELSLAPGSDTAPKTGTAPVGWLRLSYIQNPEKPDIFKINGGF